MCPIRDGLGLAPGLRARGFHRVARMQQPLSGGVWRGRALEQRAQLCAAQFRIRGEHPGRGIGHQRSSHRGPRRKRGRAAGQAWIDDYTGRCYHQACDAWDSSWNLAGAIQDIEAMRDIGTDLANSARWPEWKAGSEFAGLRKPRPKP